MIAWQGKWYITASVLKRMGIDLREMEEEVKNDPEALKAVSDQIDIIQRHLDAHLLIGDGLFQLFLPELNRNHGFRVVRSGRCREETKDGESILAYEAEDGEKGFFYRHGQTLVDKISPFRFKRNPCSFLNQDNTATAKSFEALPHNLDPQEFNLVMATFFPIQEGFEEMDVAVEDDIRSRLIDEKIPIPDDLDELIESRIEGLAEKYAIQAGKILIREIDQKHMDALLDFASSEAGDALRNSRYLQSGQLRINGERFYLDLIDETLSLIAAKLRHP